MNDSHNIHFLIADPASSDWDQDEKTVIIKVLLPEPATNNVLVKVTSEECSVVFKGTVLQ